MVTENVSSSLMTRPVDPTMQSPNMMLSSPDLSAVESATQGTSLSSPSSSSRNSPVSHGSAYSGRRPRAHIGNDKLLLPPPSPRAYSRPASAMSPGTPRSSRTSSKKNLSDASVTLAKARARTAQKLNDSMVYLDGPQIYACAQCRTHLTSHDDIISKSFHGRHGRAYLLDQCVNITIGPAEDRILITGLHSVNDIFCKRCKNMVGWTYSKAYESTQKYKEGKFIIEKINLHLEESDYYSVHHPAGEKPDRFRQRSMSWGNDGSNANSSSSATEIIYEYQPNASSRSSFSHYSPRHLDSPRYVDSAQTCPDASRPRVIDVDTTQPDLPLAPSLSL